MRPGTYGSFSIRAGAIAAIADGAVRLTLRPGASFEIRESRGSPARELPHCTVSVNPLVDLTAATSIG